MGDNVIKGVYLRIHMQSLPILLRTIITDFFKRTPTTGSINAFVDYAKENIQPYKKEPHGDGLYTAIQ